MYKTIINIVLFYMYKYDQTNIPNESTLAVSRAGQGNLSQ